MTTVNSVVSISHGNRKMGEIPSVSLPPVVTCAKGCKCAKKCYAAKLCRIYPSVKSAYDRNLEILNSDWDSYWLQVRAAACVSRFFRFHVSGDILNAQYLDEMISTAKALPNTDFLAFTKQYHLVNEYVSNVGSIPENLHILFSEWPGMEMPNPHNFPVAHVIFKGEQPQKNWNICPGNCATCAVGGCNCWALKNGEHIAFYEH